jgi:hypothetical protein
MTNTPPTGGGALKATSGLEVDTSISRLPDQKAVRGGRVARDTLRRTDAGGFEDCGQAWFGPRAFMAATEHTDRTGHITIMGRTVAYRYRPAGGAS